MLAEDELEPDCFCTKGRRDSGSDAGDGEVHLPLVGLGVVGAARSLVPEVFAPAVDALGLTTWGIAIGAAGAGITLLALRARGWLALGLTATVMALLVMGVTTRLMPSLDPLLTSRAAAAAASPRAWNSST